jgi:hypothetical protein
MKNKLFITLTLACMVGLTSCEDFLTSENTTSANQDTFFDSDDAVASGTAPLYNYVWNGFNDKAYYGMAAPIT